MSRWSYILPAILAVIFFGGIELFARIALFDLVSYTNSSKLDSSWASAKLQSDEIEVFAIGSSEILYGLDPAIFDEIGTARDCDAKTFNFGIEGFGPTHFEIVLENVRYDESLPSAKIALIGINMFERHDSIPISLESGFNCDSMAGDLQRSVFTSGFGRDTGLSALCPHTKNGSVFGWLEGQLSEFSLAYRHRQAMRSLILYGDAHHQDPSRKDVQKRVRENGFYYSAGMTNETLAFHMDRWKNNFSQIAYWQEDVQLDTWEDYVAHGGIFDRIARQVEAQNLLPVFVANPSNPVMITDTNRESFYTSNAQLMMEWTESRGYVFLDAGILGSFDPKSDFEDHRHVSGEGARKVSRMLADQFFENAIVRERIGC
ncbi:MAG: hypothetical protein AAF996_14355 [Pseudomonadota bacterium]